MKKLIPAALLAAALAPSLAAAHALLQQASPSDGSVLHTPPQSIEFMFSETARLTALSIQRQDANAAQRITLPAGASRHFVIPAPRLAPGAYTIRYRILSTDDGHITSGTIRFSVGGAGSASSAATSAAALAAAAAAAAAGPGGYDVVGTVDGVDEASGRVTISHEAIAELGWPAMTMTFTVKNKALYDKLTAGKRVQFTLAKQGELYVVTGVK